MTAWSDYCDQYGLTRVEAKIFAILADRRPHTKAELLSQAIGKQFAADNLVGQNLYRMRKKLEEHGLAIACTRIRPGDIGHYVLVETAGEARP